MSTLASYDDIKVVGVTFKNNDGSSRQEILAKTTCHDSLSIEYYEYHGEPSYYVKNLKGEILGNLPKQLSAELYKKYPACLLLARVDKILGGSDGLSYGCRIHIDVTNNTKSKSTSNKNFTSSQAIKQSNDIRLKNIILKDDILTILTESGDKKYSDHIQNYTLKFCDIQTPIIGKIYLEVIFSHPAIDHPIILKAKDNEPTFEKLKDFGKYMKKNAKVDIAQNQKKIKNKWNKGYIIACRILAIILIIISIPAMPFGLITLAFAIYILYAARHAEINISTQNSSAVTNFNRINNPDSNLQNQNNTVDLNNQNLSPNNSLLYEHNPIKLGLFDSFTVNETGKKWLCVYKYENVEIYRPDVSFSEIFEYDIVDIIPELNNPHNSDIVSVQFHGNILGYLSKGTIQDMVHDFLKRGELIRAIVQKIDGTKIFLKIYFYKPRNSVLTHQEPIIVRLSGNTNQDMQENIGYCQHGDKISIDYDFDKDIYCVFCDDLEIGYIPKSQTAILQELEADRYDFSGEIIDISENASEKYVVKVKIQPE
jgi:hypothetical protein